MLKQLSFVVCAIVLQSLLLSISAGAFGTMTAEEQPQKPVIDAAMQAIEISLRDPATGTVEEVSLFSQAERDRPVASVNGEAITLGQLAGELALMHNSMAAEPGKANETSGQRNFTRMLERLIAIKLISQEALNIGFDRTPAFQQQLDSFTQKTLIQLLLARQVENLEVDPEELEDLYAQMALEAHLQAYRFKKQEAAQQLLDQVAEGADFQKQAEQLVAAGTAEGGGDEVEYVRLTELLPNIAKAVYAMEDGEVSTLFSTKDKFLVFQLVDKRVFEDTEIRESARQRLFEEQAAEVKQAYLRQLIDTYVSFDDDAMASLDFAQIAEDNPDATAGEVLSELETDQRALATVAEPDLQLEIRVADVARTIREGLFHGTDRAIEPVELNNQMAKIIKNRLDKALGVMEAKRQGIDESAAFTSALDKKKEELLFDYFVNKAVMPDIKVMKDEARSYYQEHLDDFSGPLMLKLKSLAFNDEEDARQAFETLRSGSDFQWVSANSSGQADPDSKKLMTFGGNLLAQTALPEELQQQVSSALPGDIYFYAGPNDLYYTLMVEQVFPPQVEPYQEVREKVGGILYGQKIKTALDEWVGKLKEAYPTEVYLVPESQG